MTSVSDLRSRQVALQSKMVQLWQQLAEAVDARSQYRPAYQLLPRVQRMHALLTEEEKAQLAPLFDKRRHLNQLIEVAEREAALAELKRELMSIAQAPVQLGLV